jgi:pyrroline-5-carboxylate reductase
VETKIAIIGAGNLGTSLVKGLVESTKYQTSNFILTRRNTAKLNTFKEQGYTITSNNKEAVVDANIIILAVLPQKIDFVLNEIANSVSNNQLIISLVSGVKLHQILGSQ